MIDLARYQQFVGTQAIIEFEHSADLAKAAEALGPFIGSEFPGSLAPAGDPSAFSIRTKNAALTITAQKAVIEAQYYGNHTKDYELCHGYLSRKMRALYRGITEGMGRSANFFALITETRASFSGLSDLPVDWIRDRFLRFDSESDLV
ncbi:MAG: hypothetical protein WBQ66_04090, partial [Blastocatellia bacterium]